MFRDRVHAGQNLAAKIKLKNYSDPIVIALPRGGVPVAAEIAKELDSPMDVLIVRKLGAPQYPEFGFGAVTEGGFYILNPDVVTMLDFKESEIKSVLEHEKKEVERRTQTYRGSRPMESVQDKIVILVDDGLATGFTAAVGAEKLKQLGAKKVVLAIPVCSPDSALFLQKYVDEVVCLQSPEFFLSVGSYYDEFDQVYDTSVLETLSLFHPAPKSNDLLFQIQKYAVSFGRNIDDLRGLIDHIKDKRVVMLGESSHGTHEFYRWRKLISQELMEKHGFKFIAIEGDWPPCQRVNQFITHRSGKNATEVLRHFQRWPTWMWANTDFKKLVEWMARKNHTLAKPDQLGFYGLDVYSLFESIDEVLRQLQKIDPALAHLVQRRYACFDKFERNEQMYAQFLSKFLKGCEKEVLQALRDLLQIRLDGMEEQHEILFDAIQNARIVKNAEDYYRVMIQGNEDSWNVRDRHMMETLDILLDHHGEDSKAIVWAHNSHIGDYRETDMVDYGHVNIGGLARELYGNDQVALIGFGTYTGTVVAADMWGGHTQFMNIPPAKPESIEESMHAHAFASGEKSFYMLFDEHARDSELAEKRGHRAIGVVYHPEDERYGNYVPTSLAKRYDAFIYFDQTQALKPLPVPIKAEEIPETYPKGF